jgi:hypothetical protein
VVHRHRELLGRRGVRDWEARTLRNWAARHLGSGQPRAALRPAWKRLLKEPLALEGWWVLLKSSLMAGPASLLRRPAHV